MGMFTTFGIYIDSCKVEMEEEILEEFKNEIDINRFSTVHEKGSFSISTDYFTVFISKMDYESVEGLIEAHGLIFNYYFYFQLYQKYSESEKKVMEFTGRIMRRFKGDCVFCPNGDLYLVRENGKIIIDKREHGNYSYDLLGLPYGEGDISHYIIN